VDPTHFPPLTDDLIDAPLLLKRSHDSVRDIVHGL